MGNKRRATQLNYTLWARLPQALRTAGASKPHVASDGVNATLHGSTKFILYCRNGSKSFCIYPACRGVGACLFRPDVHSKAAIFRTDSRTVSISICLLLCSDGSSDDRLPLEPVDIEFSGRIDSLHFAFRELPVGPASDMSDVYVRPLVCSFLRRVPC